jgi:hypothetical protein
VECGATASYVADADAWIDEGSPADNKGGDSTLKVMSKSGSNLRALIGFALPEAIPEGCVVESATLQLFAGSSAGGRMLHATQVSDPWAEGSVTWSNQPATSGPVASTTSGSGYRQWDVTAQVQAMLASGVNHGFLIRDAVEGEDAEQQFYSREKAESAPQLVVTYVRTTAPPMSTTSMPPTTLPPPPPVQCGVAATYVADADAWINQGSPTDSKGSDSTLKVMSKSGSNLRALVRFATPTNVPEGCAVQTATLRMFAGSSASGRTLQALPVIGPWAEGSVTWGNQPATGGPVASATSGSGYRQWDVTAQVQAMFDGGVNHGFLIRDAVEGEDAEQQFYSREKGETAPQLVVTYARATAPSTTTTGAPTTLPAGAPTTQQPTTTSVVDATTTTLATTTTTATPATTTTMPGPTTTTAPPTTTTTTPAPPAPSSTTSTTTVAPSPG